jgi:hypothetical protein
MFRRRKDQLSCIQMALTGEMKATCSSPCDAASPSTVLFCSAADLLHGASYYIGRNKWLSLIVRAAATISCAGALSGGRPM